MYDCEVTNSSCNGKCPPGHYCEEGLKYPCPAGTFSVMIFSYCCNLFRLNKQIMVGLTEKIVHIYILTFLPKISCLIDSIKSCHETNFCIIIFSVYNTFYHFYE